MSASRTTRSLTALVATAAVVTLVAAPAFASAPPFPGGSAGALAVDCSKPGVPQPCFRTGPAVRAVQDALTARGYRLGAHTRGVYDVSTAAAVRRFKASRPELGPSNMVGPRTYASITDFRSGGTSAGSSGGGGSYASFRARAPYRWNTPSYAKWYAGQRMAAYGWASTELTRCLTYMWIGESHWQYTEVTGKYVGIPQTTPGVANDYGFTWSAYRSTPEVQVEVGLRYIRDRYGSPCKAWAFWKAQGAWQDKSDPRQFWGGWY